MKLKSKYSLNENLYKGRGLGLLKEEAQARGRAFGNTWAAEVRVAAHYGADLNVHQKAGKFTPPGASEDVAGTDAEVKSGVMVQPRGKNHPFRGKKVVRLEAELTSGLGGDYNSVLSQVLRYIRRSTNGRLSSTDIAAIVADWRGATNPDDIQPFRSAESMRGEENRPRGINPETGRESFIDQQGISSIPDLEGEGITMEALGKMIAGEYLGANSKIVVVHGENCYEFTKNDALMDAIGIGALSEYRYDKDSNKTSGLSSKLTLPVELASATYKVDNAKAVAHLKSQNAELGGDLV